LLFKRNYKARKSGVKFLLAPLWRASGRKKRPCYLFPRSNERGRVKYGFILRRKD